MTKLLLTVTVTFALATTGARAQELITYDDIKTLPEVCPAIVGNTMSATDDATATQRRSQANGVYYLKPKGSMYYVYQGVDGMSFYTRLAVPSWQTFTYLNMAAYPGDCTWSFDFTNDFSIFADENNNLPLSLTPGYQYYGGPILSYNDINYYMGATATVSFLPYVAAYNDLQWLAYLDNRRFSEMGNMLDSNFAIGTGNYTGDIYFTDSKGTLYVQENTTTACTGAIQNFPAPASPLYVKEVYMIASTYSSNKTFDPIKNEGALTLQISDQETGEEIATLTTGPGEFEYWMSNTNDTYNETYIYGGLRFAQKVEDTQLGLMVEEPFVIDRAITVRLTGFENIDNFTNEYAGCGVRLFALYDSDDPADVPDVSPTFACPEGYEYYPAYYYKERGLAVIFNGLMDYVSVADALYWSNGATITGYSTLDISNDGQTCSNAIYGADTYDLGALYVTTCCAWYDDDGNENYSFTALPEWITVPVIDTSNYDPQNSRSYYNLVSFIAAPNDTENTREATFYVQGRGYTDTTAVTVRQAGGYVVPEGITTITTPTLATGDTYSLSGQKVDATAKGVVIRDGKKIINK